MLFILCFILCSANAQAFATMRPITELYQNDSSYTNEEDDDDELQKPKKPFSSCMILAVGSNMNNMYYISSTFSALFDVTYNMHKNIGVHMISGVTLNYRSVPGSMQDVNQWYIPLILESVIAPVTREITPFISLGMGTMISEHLGFFGSKGFGLLIHSKKNRLEFHIRQIHGDLFKFDHETPTRQIFYHNSLQVCFRTHLM